MSTFTTDGKICIERTIEISNIDCGYAEVIEKFDIIQTCKWIKDNNFAKVCLQFPDHLLTVSAAIYEEIKNRTPADLYILGDTSYASCCVDTVAAMHVEAEAVIHYGHTCFTQADIPVFIVLPKKHLDTETIQKCLQANFTSDEHVKLCLFYDAEYEHCKESLSKCWYKLYPKSYIAFIIMEEYPNKKLGRVVRNNAGEEFKAENLRDCICLYLGSKSQTSFNLTVCIAAANWYLLDPGTCKVHSMEETAWFKRRRYLVEKCKDAEVIGILICKLAGDQTKSIISQLKELCKVNGKKKYIVSVGKPNVAKLANFPEIDIYVMIACPENDLYDNRDFYKPIVYPFELEMALNTNRELYFTHHVTDYYELLPGKSHHCDISHVNNSTDMSLITGKIRETIVQCPSKENTMEIAEKQSWALENIGKNLQGRTWRGLEQRLGETEIKVAENGRKGIPLQYSNEPK